MINMLKLYTLTFRKGFNGSSFLNNSNGVLTNTALKHFNKSAFGVKYFRTSSIAAQTTVSEAVCPAHSKQRNHDPTPEKPANHDAEWHARCHVDKTTWDCAKPFGDMPGLKKIIPIVGNTWQFTPWGKYYKSSLTVFLKKFHDEYGLVGRMEGVIGMEDSVFLASADDVEKVYKQEALLPERDIVGSMTYFRKHFRQDVFKDAKGLVTSNGQDWYNFRVKVNAIMMQPKVAKQYVKPIDTVAMDFVKKIKRLRKTDGTVGDNIMNEANKWALESIGLLALDQRLGALEDNLSTDSLPYKMIQNAEDIFMTSEKLDFEPSVWRYVWTPSYGKAMKLYDEQITMAQVHVDKAVEEIKEKRRLGTQDAEDKEKSVLEKLWDVDPKVALVMVSDMLFAGIDTTSTSLVNILYYLSSNPDKQDILRREILSLLPHKDDEIKADHLSKMPYLKACIKEAARIYPVTAGTMRNLTKDTVLSGYQVPKGTKIFLTHMYLSLMESQYPKPLEYIPERWLRDNETELSYKHAHPFSTMHFGFGSRACIGRRFADLELEIAVIDLVRSFNMSWKGDPPTQATIGINYLKPPFGFIFNDA